MAVSKATRSAGRKATIPPRRRILRFPQVKGKTVELVELSASLEEYTVDIRFTDKTVLTLNAEACIGVYPEMLEWKTGDSKLLKRWLPFFSV